MVHSDPKKPGHKRFIRAIVNLLEYGADEPRTKEELADFREKQGIDPGFLHERGANGLFEPNEKGDKYRLNRTAIGLLLSHWNAERALCAIKIGIGALVIGTGALIINIIMLVSAGCRPA